jgi:hypothetical protein
MADKRITPKPAEGKDQTAARVTKKSAVKKQSLSKKHAKKMGPGGH